MKCSFDVDVLALILLVFLQKSGLEFKAFLFLFLFAYVGSSYKAITCTLKARQKIFKQAITRFELQMQSG